MSAFIDLELDDVLTVGDIQLRVVKKHGRRVRLRIDAPASVKIATQTVIAPDRGNQSSNTDLSRKSATELKQAFNTGAQRNVSDDHWS